MDHLVLSPDALNPATLYYQAPSDMPEAQGLNCMHFDLPLQGSVHRVIAHARFYFQATETLFNTLTGKDPLTPTKATQSGRQFLNNATSAHEIHNALFHLAREKTQRAFCEFQRLVTHPNYPHTLLEQTPVTMHFAPLVATGFYQGDVVEKLQTLMSDLQKQATALEQGLDALNGLQEPSEERTAVEQSIVAATYTYKALFREMKILNTTMHDAFEGLQQAQAYQWKLILDALERHNRVADEVDEKGREIKTAPKAASAAAPSSLLFHGNLDDPRRELIFLTRLQEEGLHVYNVPGDDHCALHALFKDPKVLRTLRRFFCSLAPATSNQRLAMPEDPADTLTREIRLTRQLIAREVKTMMANADPNILLAKRWEITECRKARVAYSKLKNYKLVSREAILASPQARRVYANRNKDLITRDEVVDSKPARVAYAKQFKREYPKAATEADYKNIAKCYWEEFINGTIPLIQAEGAYEALEKCYWQEFVNGNIPLSDTEAAYQALEECYWKEFIDGRITLSDYHLSALSVILEMPIHVYSLDYLAPDVVRYHLLQTKDQQKALPEGVSRIERCYQEIPVPPHIAKRMNPENTLRLYHSHGHYQAILPSRA